VNIQNQLNSVTMGNPSSSSSITVTPTNITIGSIVILNGRVHRNSYGAKPGKSFTNYKCKVNLINKKGSHPYHVTTMSGGHLGWVTKESVTFHSASTTQSKKKTKKTKKKKNPTLKTGIVQTFSPTLRSGGGGRKMNILSDRLTT
jgi:hypothetical protein